MIVLDTHVLIWLLQDDPSLGTKAAALIEATARHFGAPLLTVDREIHRYAATGAVTVIDARH